MKINRVELVGNKRLLLNNIRRIVLTPSSIYQIIIGTNGSGKSTLMQEMTLLPATPAHYIKNGFKAIELEHRESKYFLSSNFSSGNGHHTFEKDGVKLNDNGTASVQKVLVEKHFGIDASLYDVLIGATKFTEMSSQVRREWITRLSGGDLDYAIKMYGKIKTALRDQQGAVKHLKSRLVTETEKLTSQEEVDRLEVIAKSLKDELTLLMENKTIVSFSKHELENKIENILIELKKVSNMALQYDLLKLPEMLASAAKSDKDIDDQLQNLKNDLSVNENMLIHYQKEYSGLSDIIEALKSSGSGDINELKDKVIRLHQQESVLLQEIKQFLIEDEPQYAFKASQNAIPDVVEVFNLLPDNTENRYSRNALLQANEELKILNEKYEKMSTYRNRALDRIEHIKSAKETNCPKCNYVWVPGVSDNELQTLTVNLEKAGKALEELSDNIKTVRETVEECNDYNQTLNRFRVIVNEYPRLKPLWDFIISNEHMFKEPQSKLWIFTTWEYDIDASVRLFEVREQIKEYQNAIDHIQNLGQGGTHYLDRISEIEKNIELHTEKGVELKRTIGIVTVYRDGLGYIKHRHDRIIELENQLSETMKNLTIANKNYFLDECINKHQLTLAMVQNDIIKSNSAVSIVNDIQLQHDKLTVDVDHWKVLMDEISPTTGFIADQLMGFIEGLVEEMNDIISTIWTYDMRILPCDVDTDELDYRFPLQVKGTDDPSADVSKSSSSQKDIVDFAFKLIVMMYLEIHDFPLFLDELAPSLDEQHRINIMNFVKQLVDGGRCSQMFMISHYQAGHGSFTSAEYCVMDSQNITVPVEYNKHVVME